MNEQDGFSTSAPEEFNYTPSEPRKGDPTGVAPPVLDDISFVDDGQRRGAPTGVTAPVLDDMADDFSYTARRGAPTGVSAPILDDMDSYDYSTPKAKAPEPQKFILSDQDIIDALSPELRNIFDNLSDEQQQKIITMRREQLGAEAPEPELVAPVLDEPDDYVPPTEPVHHEVDADLTAPVLDEQPETPEYVSKYVNRDLEKIKAEAKKKAVADQFTPHEKDKKESLRMMMELKEEKRRKMADKGFKITIALAFVGVIAAVAFYLLYAGKLGLAYKDGLTGISNIISESALYIAGAMGLSSVLLITGMGFLKSLASFIYVVVSIVQIFPGFMMIPQHEGSMGLIIALYAVAIGCSIGVVVTLSASECISAFFNRNKSY